MGLHPGHAHGHSHGPRPPDTPHGDRRLIFAIAVNVLLTVAQIVGGVFSGSLALVADAIHNLSDAAALAIALIARRIARHPADSNHTYGHGRAEMIGAVFNLSWLIFIGLFLVFEAVERFFNPQPIEGWTVVVIAVVALIIDTVTAMLTYRMAKTSMNIRAAFIHNLSDALASVGVIVGGTLIILYEWLFVDALVTIVIAVYILGHAVIEIPKAIHILMQGVPEGLDIADVTTAMQEVAGVHDIHHVHIWHIDEHRRSLEAHVMINPVDMNRMEEIKAALKSQLAERFAIGHSTLEFEIPDRDGSSLGPDASGH
ncbi:MAG: cation transporter [Rhodospirillaceae bacterium]|jgi:cobalt-zinc-cadmium efflux system protein|nr:cation transporter [Rhodospirillaceae bacterium]MBT5945003.1 cation transporter [Rhodospirillaceae bacterium]MBT6404705.1 cation transporter [Rhodospirillaceae bacterium]MBT6536427.1 cation transporter [Rhodospirillaceae bacterium]